MDESQEMMMSQSINHSNVDLAVAAINKHANSLLDDSMQSINKSTKGGDKKLHQSTQFSDAMTMSQASIDTLDNYVGPVREEFDELKRKIDEKSTEFEELETEYYSQVSKVQLELEGIGPEQDKEIEQHRHRYEM